MSGLQRIPQPPAKPIVGNTFELDPKQPIESLANLLKAVWRDCPAEHDGSRSGHRGQPRLGFTKCVTRRDSRRSWAGHWNRSATSPETVELYLRVPNKHSILQACSQLEAMRRTGNRPPHSCARFRPSVDQEHVRRHEKIIASHCCRRSVPLPATDTTYQWARFGDEPIDVPADFTRLTLDTIALCTFSHRYNSFYSQTDHPMVAAMGRSLLASGERLRRLPGTAWKYKAANKRYEEDIALQHKIADEVSDETTHTS